MPGYKRAELVAEFTVVPDREGEEPPAEQVEAAKRAAGESGLASESGPESIALSGGRSEVLAALSEVLDAALESGAHVVQVRVEAERDAPRFEGSE